jgi:hypothetical protein
VSRLSSLTRIRGEPDCGVAAVRIQVSKEKDRKGRMGDACEEKMIEAAWVVGSFVCARLGMLDERMLQSACMRRVDSRSVRRVCERDV